MATVNSVDVNGTSYDIEDTEARNGVSALKTENKTTKDNISDTDQIMIRDTTEKKDKLIDYDKLADAILTKITSKQFTLDQGSKTLVQALNELNSNVKIDNIKYIDCGGYGTLAAFSIGKLLYCKFNGNNKVSEVTQQDIAQLPSEYTLNSSIGVYRSVLVNARNTGSLQIDTYGKITLYCPYSYLYGYVIIPIK